MIFVDTNVFMYAVGNPHPLLEPAREFLRRCQREGVPLFTSAEVLQELVHAYLRVGRLPVLEAATTLAVDACDEIWPLEPPDVLLAMQLYDRYPQLTSRDLCHLASCRRRGVSEVKTLDSAFAGVAGAPSF
jgi:predicted nucleic acid-binding protein